MLLSLTNFFGVFDNSSEASFFQSVRGLDKDVKWPFALWHIVISNPELIELSQSPFSVSSLKKSCDLGHIQSGSLRVLGRIDLSLLALSFLRAIFFFDFENHTLLRATSQFRFCTICYWL